MRRSEAMAAPAPGRSVPANDTPSVRRTVRITGFPPSAWAFASRTWAAMMVAPCAAFWLQLESPSSAAVTVDILALQTRGQTCQKAAYRVLATIITRADGGATQLRDPQGARWYDMEVVCA